MKYLSLILLGASLVAGLPGAAKAGKAGKAAGAAKANGNANAAKANGNANAAKANGNGQATTAGQGNTNGQTNTGTNTNGQTNTGTNTNGQTNTGNTNGQTNTGNTNANGQTNGTPTASAPGNAVSAANVPPGANPFLAVGGGANGNSNVQFPQLTDIQKQGLQQAAVLWSQDTAIVSSALSLLGSGTMSDADFRDAADMAYIAEVDELRQKNYIDALIGQMPQLQAATTSLTNGSFAIVVDQLREMRIRGQANQTFVQAAVQGMNNLRCRQVLLAIDAYVLMANQAAGNNTVITATRPPACQQVYAQTADTLPAGAVVNATTFPNAQQLITQFNQPPRFQLSNAVAFSQNSGSDATPALGSQFTAQAPFSNTSSLAGQLLAFNGQPVQTNGDPANAAANPLNAVLFANQVNQNLGGNTNANGQTNTGTNTNGQTNTGTNTNGQTNTGTNTNGQTNTGTNTNGQTNTGTNTNGQTNTGTNATGNTNTGTNTNGQTNTGNTNAGTNATGNTKGAGNQAQAGKAGKANGATAQAGKANGATAQAGKAGKANGASAQAGKAKANN